MRHTLQTQSHIAGFGDFNFTVTALAIWPSGAAVWALFASDLNTARGLVAERSGAASQRRGHGARSPPAATALQQGQLISDLRVGRAPSRVRTVEPRAASVPRTPGLHPAFLFALFQDKDTQRSSAPQYWQTCHIHVSRPARLEAESSASPPRTSPTVGNCGLGEAPRCQRSPPSRVDGRPVLACGLRGDWRWIFEFQIRCRMLNLLIRADQTVQKS